MTDLDIAQSVTPRPITEIAAKAGIGDSYLEVYGKYKAKVDLSLLSNLPQRDGKLILVTAITPTPSGEGKTTTTIGLADGLAGIGKKVMAALREPSLGPVFGVKGGAAGGGWSQIIPMEDINLHFTGDIHAVGAANNLLASLIDNHIYQGNTLRIDPKRVTWHRCVDMNDRQLRHLVDGMGKATDGVTREDSFDITVASEVMAILCLASSLADLKQRLSRILVGYTYEGEPITAGQLHAEGAMTALLKDALKPNLVQTLGGTPVLVHGGPFANIAHGCNSVLATRMAMRLADYVVTEAGFGADLGAEKFLDIKCRVAGLKPSAVVVVATVRALKMHGGVKKDDLNREDLPALSRGLANLLRHVANLRDVYGLPVTVAINRYPSEMRIAEKIEAVVRRVYHGAGISVSDEVKKKMDRLTELGFANLPVCIAKTQYSFSDDPSLLGAPENFTVRVKDVRVSAGAGFLVVLTGDILTMPGLPKRPAAEQIDVDDDGKIHGLF